MQHDTSTAVRDAIGHHVGTFTTVYVPTPSTAADAERRYEIRRKNVAAELEHLKAGSPTVSVVGDALAEADHADATARLIVAVDTDGDASVLVDHSMIRALSRTSVTVGPVPALLPILEATQVDLSHVAVLLDRTGGDLFARNDLGSPLAVDEVEGNEVHIHRGHPGGWSQRRFQQTAENTWEKNAREVVDRLAELHPGNALVVVGGDVRAVGFFIEHLPSRYTVLEVEGSRAERPAPGVDAFLDHADLALRNRAAEQMVDELGVVREAVGVGTAKTGPEALDMVTRGLASKLVVGNDHSRPDRQTAKFDFSIPAFVEKWQKLEQVNPITAPVTDAAVNLAQRLGTDVVVAPWGALSSYDWGLVAIER